MVYLLQFVIAIRVDNTDKNRCPPLRKVDNWLLSFLIDMIGLVSTVNSFRGYWYLMDEYYLPEAYNASLQTGQALGCLVLMALGATCSLHAGVFKEDKNDAPGFLFDFYYSSYFYLMASFLAILCRVVNHKSRCHVFRKRLTKGSTAFP